MSLPAPLLRLVVSAAALALVSSAAAQPIPRARAQRIERDGISLVLPAGASLVERADVGGRQTYARIEDGLVMVRLVRGGDYAAVPEDATGTPARVCGRVAMRYELTLPGYEAIGSRVDDEGHVEHLPPVVQPDRIVILLRTSLADGTAVRIEWEIVTAARARWAARERAFFASIRCTHRA